MLSVRQKGFDYPGPDRHEALIPVTSVEARRTPCRRNLQNPDPGSKAVTVNMTAATYKLPTLSKSSAGHGTYLVLSPDNSKR